MAGTLEILNVGAGDVVITFDKTNPAEQIRAKRIIKDMLKRGYALLVKMEDGTHQITKSFDENAGEYIIADFDPDSEDEEEHSSGDSDPQIKRRGRPKTRRVSMDNATAGGALTGASPNRFDRRRHCEDETGGGPNSPRLICSDCPPVGYPTDRTRCADCPRHAAGGAA